VYLLSVAGLIACKDANLFEAFSCSWTPSSTFYKLLEIERTLYATTPPHPASTALGFSDAVASRTCDRGTRRLPVVKHLPVP
jgi:hypothetical protein